MGWGVWVPGLGSPARGGTGNEGLGPSNSNPMGRVLEFGDAVASRALGAHDSDHGVPSIQWGGSQDLGAQKEPDNTDTPPGGGRVQSSGILFLGSGNQDLVYGTAIQSSGGSRHNTRFRRAFGTEGIQGSRISSLGLGERTQDLRPSYWVLGSWGIE